MNANPTSACPSCGKALGPTAVHGLCPECLMRIGVGAASLEATVNLGVSHADSGRFTPPTPADLAAHFPQLEIAGLLGQGGMGAVYKARQRELDRWVALKVLPAEDGKEPSFASRFAREARALARLNHPNIVTIYDFGHAGGFYFFIMEYVDGLSLRHALNARTLDPKAAVAIVPQVCEALQYAHDQGVVHRDIKPENILLDKQGHIKIADFGLAKIMGTEPQTHSQTQRLTQSQERMGTPQYMAPEQLERPLEVDHRADIYSLGVVFYEMLTGELPLGRFPAPSRKVQIDFRLDEVVLRALEKQPELRYQQASEIKTRVETIATSHPAEKTTEATPAPAVPLVEASRPRIGLKVAFGALAVLLLAWPVWLTGVVIFQNARRASALREVAIVESLHAERLQDTRRRIAVHVDLAKHYPTTLLAGDAVPGNARPWQVAETNIYAISQFQFTVGDSLQISTGPGNLGIGHSKDGAVWAIVMPTNGTLRSKASTDPELIEHVWLRFHPGDLRAIFASSGVRGGGDKGLLQRFRVIANHKMQGSWHAGELAMIPDPGQMTVDVDTQGSIRRFFKVETVGGQRQAEYVDGFRTRPAPVVAKGDPSTAEASFDRLWEAFDRQYAMFVLRPEVDWAQARAKFRPRAITAQSAQEFAEVCAEMLEPLRDLHIWIKAEGVDVPVYNRNRESNANPRAIPALLGKLATAGRRVGWARTDEKIGYLAIRSWDDNAIPDQVDQVLDQMRDTRCLIVDVRLNGGGSEPLAEQVAGRFLEKSAVYAYSQFRGGSKHTDLTEKKPRSVNPRGPWRYDRPVILLIGQRCMSSNESFIGMMEAAPQVTTMGDRTCGSSGNPTTLSLPVGVTVSLPRWIDLLADGQPLDERGIQPKVKFNPQAGAFEGDRDDLLAAALDKARALPLPETPIPAPRVAAAGEEDADRPRVVSVSPAGGAADVEPSTEIRVRFDREMNPTSVNLGWEAGGFHDCGRLQYDTNKHEFVIPVRLAAGLQHEVFVNEKPFGPLGNRPQPRSFADGFMSKERAPAKGYSWKFTTKSGLATRSPGPKPEVASLSPAAGSSLAVLDFVEIQFNQPMMPPSHSLPYIDGGLGSLAPAVVPFVRYDAQQQRFSVPLVAPANQTVGLRIEGFKSESGVAADPVRLHYETGSNRQSQALSARIEQAAKDPKLREVLEQMRLSRTALASVIETVQTVHLSRTKGLCTGLRANTAVFKWQQPNQFYADATGPMTSCNAFRVGGDGQQCWWHFESGVNSDKKLVVCPASEIHQKNVQICDPFNLALDSVDRAIRRHGLLYGGMQTNQGRLCHVLDAWNVVSADKWHPMAHLTRWLIDGENYRPLLVTSFWSGIGDTRTEFAYEKVNEPLPAADFAPPKVDGVEPEPVEALDGNYVRRFLNAIDGSNGRMSVRWGKEGPKARSSSGLN